jgi:CheY-like chemotaxis protein
MPTHILFVDDDPDIQRVEHERLQRFGYTVTTRSTAQGALNAYTQAPDAYDAIVADYRMPGINGLELARKLRQNGCGRPIVLMSGGQNGLSEYRGHVGFDAFLPKPVGGKELDSVLRQLLHG